MRSIAFAAIAALAVVFAGCTGQRQQSSAPQTSATAELKNPTDFPLADGSTILDVKPFAESIASSDAHGSMLGSQGAGTYTGTELLASSPKSAGALRAWLSDVGRRPPTGYTYQTGSATTTGSVARTLDTYGIAYAAFRSANPAVNRGVVVVVMDPKLVKEKLGLALDLIDKYRNLPGALRDPIDKQVKSSTGFTVTEATDPSSPLGMTLLALRELQSSDERAIVMVDGTKK
jgi:hypothetical protein